MSTAREFRVRVLACDSRATREGCQVARERHCTSGYGLPSVSTSLDPSFDSPLLGEGLGMKLIATFKCTCIYSHVHWRWFVIDTITA